LIVKLQVSTKPFKARLAALRHRLEPRLRRVLAIASDGCQTTGAVIGSADGIHLDIEALAVSRAMAFETAAEDIVAALKAQNVVLPKQAVLATASFLPAVLELPVQANKALPAEKMLEMIRWELEPLFAQQAELWSLGRLLHGRGHLDASQRRQIEDIQAASRAAARGRGGRATARFGELAVEHGFVTHEQVEECLLLQEQLRAGDTDIALGWHEQAVGPGTDPSQSAWLCAGIGSGIRDRWVEALERLDLRLAWFYPLTAASAPLTALAGLAVGLELQSSVGVCYRVREGALAQLACRPFTDTMPRPAEALRLAQPVLRPDDRRVGFYPDEGLDFAAALSHEWNREIAGLADFDRLRVPSDNTVPTAALAALSGCAAHAMGLAPAALAVRLPGSQPLPPLHRRPPVWMGAAAALVLSVIGGFELHDFRMQNALKQKHQELSAQKAKLETAKSEAERAVRAAQETRRRLDAARADLQTVALRDRLYQGALGERAKFMNALLAALVDLIHDEVLLDSVVETDWKQVEIQGFALHPEAAYRYSRALVENLEKFGLKLGDMDAGEAQGPQGLMGYRFNFVLQPDRKGGA
jgi:hypothetical protein